MNTDSRYVNFDHADAVLQAELDGEPYAAFLDNDLSAFMNCIRCELAAVHGVDAADDMLEGVEVIDPMPPSFPSFSDVPSFR